MSNINTSRRKKDVPGSRQPGRPLVLPEPEPWDRPVDGAALLDELADVFKLHLVLPPGGAEAMALWVAHTYALDYADTSPRLVISSPEKRCGKTTALTVLGHLVMRPLSTSNISAAGVFRTIEVAKPTLLMDEADTYAKRNDELRGVLNSGHSKSNAFVVRNVKVQGGDYEPRKFSTWTPIAIALIGRLPATLEDRALMVQMRRRLNTEKVDRLTPETKERLSTIARKCVRWFADNRDSLKDPKIPGALDDRAADNWRPLFAIANAAGGEWPQRAREASLRLSAVRENTTSSGVMLLADLKQMFDERGTDRLKTDEILRELTAMENRPWPEYSNCEPLTSRQLAKLLEPFGVKPKTVRFADDTAKGYERSDLEDTFARYLPRGENPAPSDVTDASHPVTDTVTSADDEKAVGAQGM